MDPRACFRLNTSGSQATEDAIAETTVDQTTFDYHLRTQTAHAFSPPPLMRNHSSAFPGDSFGSTRVFDGRGVPFSPDARRRSTVTSRPFTGSMSPEYDFASIPSRASGQSFRTSSLPFWNASHLADRYCGSVEGSPRARYDFEAKAHRTLNDTLYCVVQFKNYRAEVYEFPHGFGLDLQLDQMVLVEADRGSDLGIVVAVDQTLAEAVRQKIVANQQHTRELLRFSTRATQHARMFPAAFNLAENSNHHNSTAGPIYSTGSHFPKAIRRLALDHEIVKFKDKSHAEDVAREMCQQKADKHGLRMEVLDAEYQM